MDGMAVTATVYVVQEMRNKNLLAAERFGSLRALLGPDDQVVLNAAPTVRHLRTELRSFGDEDYLLAIGDPVAIGIACAVAAAVNNGRFKVLKWDRFERRYYVVQVDLTKGES